MFLLNFIHFLYFALFSCVQLILSHELAGQERFRSVTHAYYRDAHGKLFTRVLNLNFYEWKNWTKKWCSWKWVAWDHGSYPWNERNHITNSFRIFCSFIAKKKMKTTSEDMFSLASDRFYYQNWMTFFLSQLTRRQTCL